MRVSSRVMKAVCAVIAVTLTAILVACVSPADTDPSDLPATPEILAGTYFTGCAYLDQDDDGVAGREEPLIGGLLYEVDLAGGAGFESETTDGQCAIVIIPSALEADAWPINVRMVVPETADVKIVSPAEITLQYPERRAEFLFARR